MLILSYLVFLDHQNESFLFLYFGKDIENVDFMQFLPYHLLYTTYNMFVATWRLHSFISATSVPFTCSLKPEKEGTEWFGGAWWLPWLAPFKYFPVKSKFKRKLTSRWTAKYLHKNGISTLIIITCQNKAFNTGWKEAWEPLTTCWDGSCGGTIISKLSCRRTTPITLTVLPSLIYLRSMQAFLRSMQLRKLTTTAKESKNQFATPLLSHTLLWDAWSGHHLRVCVQLSSVKSWEAYLCSLSCTPITVAGLTNGAALNNTHGKKGF